MNEHTMVSCFVKELILVYYPWLQRQKARITNCEKVFKETYKDINKTDCVT